eukprot:CAMPEP_0169366282 /NCGR_PEP_ID=MMETSP1017-20121227/33031_1 /TAXON_ID=342587 /ORGANISM="Karlodinium micrum, Strain CCMP2283" /LENGTH=363 /DNA_ID=CAMNT_0009464203 /DNA_START=48 /DNA_END=1139 /DNA_ORIENTATION=+
MNVVSLWLVCIAAGDPTPTGQHSIRYALSHFLRSARHAFDVHSSQVSSGQKNSRQIDTNKKTVKSLARTLLAIAPHNALPKRARRTKRPIASLSPDSWTLGRKIDGSYKLEAAEDGFIGKVVYTQIPRSAEAPSLGLGLEEIASNGKAGMVGISSIVEGGNGAQASEPLLPGDMLSSAREVDSLASEVSLEGLTFDKVVSRLSTLNPEKDVFMEVKRLTRIPRAQVRVVFPEADEKEDQVITLYPGANLRRAMLVNKVKLNDPLARRFDVGYGTGSCDGEGTCATCAVEVRTGMRAFNPPEIQESQILINKPGWRLACKTTVGNLKEDEEVTIKVMPRAFKNYYRPDDVDVDGKPLARDTGSL